jgi:hypothetical protein
MKALLYRGRFRERWAGNGPARPPDTTEGIPR